MARLTELVVKAGLLRPEQVEEAQRRGYYGKDALAYAAQRGWCDDAAVGRLIAEQCAVPFLDLTDLEPPVEVASLLPLEVLLKHGYVPVNLRDGVLTLAMVDPTNIYAVDDARFLTGYNVEVAAAAPLALRKAIDRVGETGTLDRHSDARGHSLERTEVSGLREWWVGGAFAFHPGTSTVLFLRDGEPHALGTVARASSTPIVPAAPRALFTDRELYGPHEPLRVGLLCPERAGQRVEVELSAGLSRLPPLEVALDGNGLGRVELPAPPPGTYALKYEEVSASFTVAAYGLSPLHVRWHATKREGRRLEGELHAQVLGAPLEGTLVLGLLDGAFKPPRRVHTLQVQTDGSGRATVRIPLGTRGPASLEVRVEGRESLTATVSLEGTERSMQEPVPLCRWGQEQLASSLPFEGSTPLRGLHVGPGPGGVPAPVRLVEVSREVARLELTEAVIRGVLVAVTAGGGRVEVPFQDGVPGQRLEVPVRGPWTLLLVGALLPGGVGARCWEGRAAVLPPSFPLEVDVPARVRPGDAVALTVRGAPGASAWVSVRDARVTVRRPGDVAAAALRGDLAQKLSWPLEDGELLGNLDTLFPRHQRVYSGVFLDELVSEDAAGRDSAPDEAQAPAPPPLAEAPPAVVLCQQVTLGGDGQARVDFPAPRLRGPLEVDVLGALSGDCASARASLEVHAAVHGELLLPRYVSAGERAAGTLLVTLDQGEAEVEVWHEGTPQRLHEGGRSATRLTLSSPGGEVRFDAMAGTFEAEVRASGGEVQRVGGRVEHPGRALWTERSVVALAPGGRLEVVGRDARARVTPGIGLQARRMAGALKDYAYSCAEQTAAIILATVSELLMGSDRQHALTLHLSGAVERLERMATPSGHFRAYPDMPVNLWLSETAATHLLELEGVEAGPAVQGCWHLVREALQLGQRAALAHGLEVAPPRPLTARQALACVRRSPERALELAGQVLAGVGPWQDGLAVLRLGPEGGGDSRYRLESEVRAETAYGAAVLLRAGPELLSRALPLVRTALGGLEESGRCYSTLDSVAALALLSSLRHLGSSAHACGVDGTRLSLEDALQRTAVHSIEAVDGPLFVETERLREEDLDTLLRGDVAGTVRLERTAGERRGPLLPGEPLELVVRLDGGYCAGDLLQVFLPPALAWLHGGAQARGFSLDFEGRDALRVPLVVTAATVDAAGRSVPQRCAVYLRNMYDARRGSAFDALTVETGGQGVLEQRVAGATPPPHLQATAAAEA